MKLIELIDAPLSGEWGEEDEFGLGVPVIRTANFCDNGKINYSNIVTRLIPTDKLNKKTLKYGDIIIEKSGGTDLKPVGRVVFFEQESNIYMFNNFAATIRVKDTTKILPKYLFYYLFNFYWAGGTKKFENRTSGIHNLKLNNMIESIDISLPDIITQEKIVNIFDLINDGIDNVNYRISLYDELVKSRFIELFGDTIMNPFGWEKDSLGAVCDVRDGTHDSPKYYETGYPLVTSKNVTGGNIDLTDCSLICEEDFNKINERSKVDIGDIIMPMIGTVGKPVIVDIEPKFAIKNVALIKFKSNSRVLNIYIRALLQSDYFDDAVLSKVRGGTQKFISLGDIRKLEVLVPPIDLQKQFATFVEQTDKSKLAATETLKYLEELKTSLMSKYFE